MQVIVIRHTAVERPDGCCIGRSDLPLSSTYAVEYPQVRDSVIQLLGGRMVSRVLTSPLSRCSRLAADLSQDPALAFALSGQAAESDERLLEFNYGSWEGQNWDDIDPTRLRYWMENWRLARAGEPAGSGTDTGEPDRKGDGESLEDMLFRVADLCRDLHRKAGEASATHDRNMAVLITHAGVIRCLHHLLRRVPVSDIFSIDISYGAVAEFSLSFAPVGPQLHEGVDHAACE